MHRHKAIRIADEMIDDGEMVGVSVSFSEEKFQEMLTVRPLDESNDTKKMSVYIKDVKSEKELRKYLKLCREEVL